MKLFVVVLCLVTIAMILWEAFEALVLPRRISRPLRLARAFYQGAWRLWRGIARALPPGRRDDFVAAFGPLALLVLLALWASVLIGAFALLQFTLRTPLSAPERTPTLGTYLYLSATTFITLGFGDVAPRTGLGRFLTDLEAGIGFGFLAIVVGYLPVFYSAFARREVEIGMLDARASTPPSAGEFLRRLGPHAHTDDLLTTLRNWERWSAELLESHLSYAALLYYRSQHDKQSWLAALTTILDTSALILAAFPDGPIRQAELTFAMARHAAVDLRLAIGFDPAPSEGRLNATQEGDLLILLRDSGWSVRDDAAVRKIWRELRALYEPHLLPLSDWLLLPLPTILPDPNAFDNWRTSRDPDAHFLSIPHRHQE